MLSQTLILIGVASIIGGIIGGGVKLVGVEFREIPSLRRQLTLIGFGVLLAGVGWLIDPERQRQTTEGKTDEVPTQPQSQTADPELNQLKSRDPGAQVRASIEPSQADDGSSLADCANGELGTEEQPLGSNRGARVDQYLTAANAPSGSPWSVAFVTWCLQRAGYGNVLPVTASTVHLIRAARRAGLYHKIDENFEPRAGDIFVAARNEDALSGRAAIVTQHSRMDGYTTIAEGNYNHAVVRRSVPAESALGYIRVGQPEASE